MKKAIIAIILSATMMSGCASIERSIKDMKSDVSGGIDRIVTVYTANGEVLKTYTGKIDIAPTDGGLVKFELDGQRIMYYNCYVEVIENKE